MAHKEEELEAARRLTERRHVISSELLNVAARRALLARPARVPGMDEIAVDVELVRREHPTLPPPPPPPPPPPRTTWTRRVPHPVLIRTPAPPVPQKRLVHFYHTKRTRRVRLSTGRRTRRVRLV